jgi:AcrR family transcriptional regulator
MATKPPFRLAKKRRDQYHHGDLRQALLAAALRTIQKHGVQALTLRAVGKDLGVSQTALYRHFADKSALLAAVAREGFRLLRLALVAGRESAEGLDGFQAMGEAYVRFAVENPSHYRVMFGADLALAEPDPELEAEGAASFQVLVDALIELERAALIRPDPAQELARYVWAIVHGIAMLAIDGRLARQNAGVDSVVRFSLERLRTGILPAPGACDKT